MAVNRNHPESLLLPCYVGLQGSDSQLRSANDGCINCRMADDLGQALGRKHTPS